MSFSNVILDWQLILNKTYEKCIKDKTNITKEHNAHYIPYLNNVNPKLFSISVCTVHGEIYNVGDYTHEFAIESVSKLFTLALALKKYGAAQVKSKIGDNPIHQSFNSVNEIIQNKGTLNSLHNGGALATASIVYTRNDTRASFEKKVFENMNAFAGRKLKMSQQVFKSEYEKCDHNRAIAYLLRSYGKFYVADADVEDVLNVYTRQCSALVTSEDIAVMAATLANNGTNPVTRERILGKKNVNYIINQMIIAGLYNDSIQWNTTIGIPAKSGVGGILLLVIPGLAGIGICSPPIDKFGTSIRGKKAAKELLHLLTF